MKDPKKDNYSVDLPEYKPPIPFGKKVKVTIPIVTTVIGYSPIDNVIVQVQGSLYSVHKSKVEVIEK